MTYLSQGCVGVRVFEEILRPNVTDRTPVKPSDLLARVGCPARLPLLRCETSSYLVIASKCNAIEKRLVQPDIEPVQSFAM